LHHTQIKPTARRSRDASVEELTVQPDTKIKELKIAAIIGAAFVRPDCECRMGGRANYWHMEQPNHASAADRIPKCIYNTRKLARVYVFDYIEVFYN